jgi:hypothetical protein
VELPPYGTGLLVAGTPRAGKSSVMLAVFEAIRALDYQVCLIDPEGDFERLPNMVTLGDLRAANSRRSRPGCSTILRAASA